MTHYDHRKDEFYVTRDVDALHLRIGYGTPPTRRPDPDDPSAYIQEPGEGESVLVRDEIAHYLPWLVDGLWEVLTTQGFEEMAEVWDHILRQWRTGEALQATMHDIIGQHTRRACRGVLAEALEKTETVEATT